MYRFRRFFGNIGIAEFTGGPIDRRVDRYRENALRGVDPRGVCLQRQGEPVTVLFRKGIRHRVIGICPRRVINHRSGQVIYGFPAFRIRDGNRTVLVGPGGKVIQFEFKDIAVFHRGFSDNDVFLHSPGIKEVFHIRARQNVTIYNGRRKVSEFHPLLQSIRARIGIPVVFHRADRLFHGADQGEGQLPVPVMDGEQFPVSGDLLRKLHSCVPRGKVAPAVGKTIVNVLPVTVFIRVVNRYVIRYGDIRAVRQMKMLDVFFA